MIGARRTDIILIDKKDRKGIIIDIAVPTNVRVGEKETEKVEKYHNLKRDRLEDCGDSKSLKLYL